MSLYAGIDAGTQSLKVVVYDPATKQVVACTSEALALDSRDDGSREQEPSAWADAMRVCFGRIDAAVRRRIVALSISGQQHGFGIVAGLGVVMGGHWNLLMFTPNHYGASVWPASRADRPDPAPTR